jgi:hypothetical protein
MFTIQSNQACSATLTVTDAKGNIAKLDGAPVWASSDETILAVSASVDGLSGSFQAVGPAGSASITVTGDADLNAGISSISGVLDVVVVLADVLATQITIVTGLPFVVSGSTSGSASGTVSGSDSGSFSGSISGSIGSGSADFTLNADGVTYTRNSDGVSGYVLNSDGTFSATSGSTSGTISGSVSGSIGTGSADFTLNTDSVTYTRNSDGVSGYVQNSDGTFSLTSGSV